MYGVSSRYALNRTLYREMNDMSDESEYVGIERIDRKVEDDVVKDILKSDKTNTGFKYISLKVNKGKITISVKIPKTKNNDRYSFSRTLESMDKYKDMLVECLEFISDKLCMFIDKDKESKRLGLGMLYLNKNRAELPRKIYHVYSMDNTRNDITIVAYSIYNIKNLLENRYGRTDDIEINCIGFYTGVIPSVEFDLSLSRVIIENRAISSLKEERC